jgi:hypothetical protein
VMNGLTYNFGLRETDCEYIPYWDALAPTAIVKGGPDVFATAWKRPGQARVLVSNLSPESRTVEVQLDPAKLGLPAGATATDEQTGEAVALGPGLRLSLPVERHGYRVVLVGAKGQFPPIPEAEKGLSAGAPIARLCDDFATLSREWTVLPTNKPARLVQGMLRLDEVPHLVSRPFHEDSCSVQVKIRARHGLYGSAGSGGYWGGGPSLYLYWNKGTYVQMVAGHENAMPHGPHVRAVAVARGTPVPISDGEGPVCGTVTWVRISLSAGEIAFSCSLDGAQWTPMGTLARTGFEGPPAFLLLGNGVPGDKDFFENRAEANGAASFFDELITER